MPYFPIVTSATPRRRYVFGEFRATLFDTVRSAQRIEYHFILIVFRGADQVPCLAVASEYHDDTTKASPFLGVFPGEGHLNLGDSPDWTVLDKFAPEAVRVAIRHLELPENQEVLVEEVRRKPWWQFW
jgi:hypothetical protein